MSEDSLRKAARRRVEQSRRLRMRVAAFGLGDGRPDAGVGGGRVPELGSA